MAAVKLLSVTSSGDPLSLVVAVLKSSLLWMVNLVQCSFISLSVTRVYLIFKGNSVSWISGTSWWSLWTPTAPCGYSLEVQLVVDAHCQLRPVLLHQPQHYHWLRLMKEHWTRLTIYNKLDTRMFLIFKVSTGSVFLREIFKNKLEKFCVFRTVFSFKKRFFSEAT